VEAVRAAVGSEFPILLRFSQWKQQDFLAKLAKDPAELERFLAPLARAGVDMFHCSTRRFWEPEFPDTGSDLNLAGWTKKISGLPTITVGSVGLNEDFITAYRSKGARARRHRAAARNAGAGRFRSRGRGPRIDRQPRLGQQNARGHFDRLVGLRTRRAGNAGLAAVGANPPF
jgi:2,4-dienoyl-CoA reductase-like NADH-dependent reductase (Old Yellow Enzyme family)